MTKNMSSCVTGYAENIQYMGRLQTQNTNSEMDLNKRSEIGIVACEKKKSPAGDKRIMRMKGAIFSPSSSFISKV